MSTYGPKVDDYVRVSHEGTVKNVTQYGTISILLPNGRIIYFDDNEVTFEKINPPEPEWKPGDVVMAADKNVYVRTESAFGAWTHVAPGAPCGSFRYDFPTRPLRRLVPEEK